MFDIDLPKWPQCIISGKDVTKEQALEIIRRTDTFFQSPSPEDLGNDKELAIGLKKHLEFPEFNSLDIEESFLKFEKWKEKWGVIKTEYIFNSWINCCWIGGYHGWCSPEGEIGFRNNIGKWPTVDSVYKDWEKLSSAFPFLDLTCTLMSTEESELKKISLVSYKVKNGRVEILEKPIPEYKLEFKGIYIDWEDFSPKKESYWTLEELKKLWTKV